MTAVQLDGRRVPATPPERAPAPDVAHAQLCAGDTAAAADLLERLRTPGGTDAQDVALYGRWLFQCLLAPAWQAVTTHPSVVAARAVELALSWPVDETDLHRLVWEAMYDDKAPLVGHPDRLVAVTRLVPGPVTDVEKITGVPRVLFAAGSPLADRTIRPGAMFMGLLRALDASGRCRSSAIQNASIEDLRAACERFMPDVVHLVAHGQLLEGGRGALMLRGQSDSGQEEADAEALVAAVSAGRAPHAIVLSACNTASPGESSMDPADASPLAVQLVQAGIPIVSAMAGEVGEGACRLYTRRLAEAIHEGRSVVEASAHGRRAALVHSPAPSADINWALPTLYLAEGLDPGQRLVDAARANAVLQLADGLGLRREPVFIGRERILAEADRLVDPDAKVGVVAALAEASTTGQGGTRLLQEIGWRLIRDGHVPVLPGPYASPATAPQTLRSLVHEILCRVITVTEKMDLELDVPKVLWADLQPGDIDALRAQVETAPSPSVARLWVRKALAGLRDRPGDLDPAQLRDLVADDLLGLAVRARAWGPPFGEHTRVVLLCNDVHAWGVSQRIGSAAPLGALDGLLAMLDASGLGRTGKPVPVVVTGSKTSDGGPALKTWSANGLPGFRMMQLEDLSTDDAVLGFQWVLLHPWTTKQEDDEREMFGGTYTASPGKAELWEEALRTLGGRPTKVEELLYVVASSHVATKTCRRDDDERAWRLYADANPGYLL